MSDLVGQIDDLVHHPKWNPYRGYANSGQQAAFQQVRQEFIDFVHVLEAHSLLGNHRMLQLGMGLSNCSHAIWQLLGRDVITIDTRDVAINYDVFPGLDTHSAEAINLAERYNPFSVLFIDAGHVYEDVRRDHDDYNGFVRPGGIVAFHDAVHRPQYDSDHHVWRYLDDHHPAINRIGTEVGIAWYLKN